jgi:hypothetical protein
MTTHISLNVETPLGEGVFQLARYMVRKEFRYLVRIRVTPEVELHLADKNCLTHKAKLTALFAFSAAELGLTDEETK